jgi:hypothetical protein
MKCEFESKRFPMGTRSTDVGSPQERPVKVEVKEEASSGSGMPVKRAGFYGVSMGVFIPKKFAKAPVKTEVAVKLEPNPDDDDEKDDEDPVSNSEDDDVEDVSGIPDVVPFEVRSSSLSRLDTHVKENSMRWRDHTESRSRSLSREVPKAAPRGSSVGPQHSKHQERKKERINLQKEQLKKLRADHAESDSRHAMDRLHDQEQRRLDQERHEAQIKVMADQLQSLIIQTQIQVNLASGVVHQPMPPRTVTPAALSVASTTPPMPPPGLQPPPVTASQSVAPLAALDAALAERLDACPPSGSASSEPVPPVFEDPSKFDWGPDTSAFRDKLPREMSGTWSNRTEGCELEFTDFIVELADGTFACNLCSCTCDARQAAVTHAASPNHQLAVLEHYAQMRIAQAKTQAEPPGPIPGAGVGLLEEAMSIAASGHRADGQMPLGSYAEIVPPTDTMSSTQAQVGGPQDDAGPPNPVFEAYAVPSGPGPLAPPPLVGAYLVDHAYYKDFWTDIAVDSRDLDLLTKQQWTLILNLIYYVACLTVEGEAIPILLERAEKCNDEAQVMKLNQELKQHNIDVLKMKMSCIEEAADLVAMTTPEDPILAKLLSLGIGDFVNDFNPENETGNFLRQTKVKTFISYCENATIQQLSAEEDRAVKHARDKAMTLSHFNGAAYAAVKTLFKDGIAELRMLVSKKRRVTSGT